MNKHYYKIVLFLKLHYLVLGVKINQILAIDQETFQL